MHGGGSMGVFFWQPRQAVCFIIQVSSGSFYWQTLGVVAKTLNDIDVMMWNELMCFPQTFDVLSCTRGRTRPHLQRVSSSNGVQSDFPGSWWLPFSVRWTNRTFPSVSRLRFLAHPPLFFFFFFTTNKMYLNVCFCLPAHLSVCLVPSWSSLVEKGPASDEGCIDWWARRLAYRLGRRVILQGLPIGTLS